MVERTARAGDPRAIAFPLAQFQDGAPDFSFSGLKTAVSLHVRQHAPLAPGRVADVCASFQATAVKMLVRKTIRAARQLGIRRILLTGGVAANRALRDALEVECAERGYTWTAPPPAALHGQRRDDRGGRGGAPRGRGARRPRVERPRDAAPGMMP